MDPVEEAIRRVLADPDIAKRLRGEVGQAGQTGDEGKQGARGPRGIPGRQGERGEQGHSDLPGPRGLPGLSGPKGDTGIAGIAGGPAVGPPGPRGSVPVGAVMLWPMNLHIPAGWGQLAIAIGFRVLQKMEEV